MRNVFGEGYLHALNPFTNHHIPVVFHDEVGFTEKDVFLASSHIFFQSVIKLKARMPTNNKSIELIQLG